MSASRKYMAASVPRSLRLTRPGVLPPSCVIGTRVFSNAKANSIVDVVMMRAPEFQRMKTNIGVHHVMAPALKMGATFTPGFIFTDIRELVVPADESDPYNFAKNYFLEKFGIVSADNNTVADNILSEFARFSGEML